MITKIIAWLIFSSKDPEKFSLMLKGLIGTGITWAVLAGGLLHFYVPVGDLNTLGNTLTFFLTTLLSLVPVIMTVLSAWATLWGAIRKVWTTFDGTNAVVNQLSEK